MPLRKLGIGKTLFMGFVLLNTGEFVQERKNQYRQDSLVSINLCSLTVKLSSM